MQGFIDTHAHLYGSVYTDDLEAVILRAKAAGCVAVFLPPTDLESIEECRSVAERFSGFAFPMIGLHPEDLPDDLEPSLRYIEDQLTGEHPFIAIGEVGLDYYWDSSRAELQKEAFRRQIEIAVSHKLPLMIHSRKAQTDLLQILREFRGTELSGVFHCFGGSVGKARELLAFSGFCLGIGGTLTFKKSILPQVLAEGVPLSRIVLETDSPYMAPVPVRGSRNEPANLRHVIARLAEVYGVTEEAIAEQTTLNALRILPRAMVRMGT